MIKKTFGVIYKIYIGFLSAFFTAFLFLFCWKKSTLNVNARLCGMAPTALFRLKFYFRAASDFFQFVHGFYAGTISIHPKDEKKLRKMRISQSMLITAHYHNWELLASWLKRKGVPLLGAGRPFSNRFAGTILSQIRARLKISVITEQIPRQALAHLNSGHCFGVLWDQFSPKASTRSLFFNHWVGVDPLPFFLYTHSRCPLFTGVLLPSGVFRIIQIAGYRCGTYENVPAEKPFLDQALFLSSNGRPISSSKLARRYHQVLEICIRSHPTFWFGFAHRRFKDVLDYRSEENVSRETPNSRRDLVSRETLATVHTNEND